MPSALEGRRQPECENLVGETEGDNAAADREDVGIVVLTREPGGEQIVTERGPDAAHLVRGDLLPLTAAAEHDAALGTPVRHRTADGDADGRVVDSRLAVGAVI